MRIWRLGTWLPAGAARLSRRGTWSNPRNRPLCAGCIRSFERRVSPLIVEWQDGTGPEIADVTDAGFASDFVLTERAVETLEPFKSWHAGPVEVRNAPTHLQLPPLADLLADAEVSADVELSSLEIDRRCQVCGTTTWRLIGAGRMTLVQGEDGPVREEVQRQGVGLIVRRRDVGSNDIFKLAPLPTWTVVTDSVRDAVTEVGLTGARFFEVGSIVA